MSARDDAFAMESNFAGRFDRRGVLRAGAGLVGGLALGACGAFGVARREESLPPASSSPSDHVLVLVELFGGNDGLSTLVPHQDDAYQRARPTLRLSKAETLRLTDERGLHPSLVKIHDRFHEGQVAVVEGVGMANPNYSHFRTLETWHTARREGRASGPGWIARLREGAWSADANDDLVVHVGGDMPYSLYSPARPAVSFRIASELEWLGDEHDREAYALAAAAHARSGDAATSMRERDRVLAELRRTLRTSQASTARIQAITDAYRARAEYPMEPFAQSLRVVAALLQSDIGTRVFSITLGNFDTHGATQKRNQMKLLGRFDAGIDAFLADIAGTSAEKRTLGLAYSEFGRRVEENQSQGTDHGAAGPLWFFGSPVRGGLHGQHPSVEKLDEDGNLVYSVDFRRAYATALERWLATPSREILGDRYEPLDVLRAPV
jgi:uncharacterized protein (DUF1501 family)